MKWPWSKARLRGACFEHSHTPMICVDGRGEVVDANGAGEKLLTQLTTDFGGLEAALAALGAEASSLTDRQVLRNEDGTLRIEVSALPRGRWLLEWRDFSREAAQQQRLDRLTRAMDCATTNLMIVDTDFEIVYVNEATRRTLRGHAEELRKFYPDFDPDGIVGTSIDLFHRHPERQRAILRDDSKRPFRTNIQVGELTFRLQLSAVRDDDGRVIAYTNEWFDLTDQARAEAELAVIVESAARGSLGIRIDTGRYDGLLQNLAEGINGLLDAVQRPTDAMIELAQRLATGDLRCRMEGEYSGAFAQLAQTLNSSVARMEGIVREVAENSRRIGGSAREVADASADLSRRTEQQAASVEETGSSLLEFSTSIEATAQNARQADDLVRLAREHATAGATAAANTIQAMSEIQSSSRKISEIISVIDDIAFQTNLLALNAAVEAARAGEQGRGFAVVAGEVRNLAQRSAAAADEIKNLIVESLQKVDQGERMVADSTATLEEIVEDVKKAGDLFATIAVATTEQAQGVAEITTAMKQIDDITQQNAAMVEESAAAAAGMDQMAANLVDLIRFFDAGGHESGAGPAPTAPSAVMPAQTEGPSCAWAGAPELAPTGAPDDEQWDEF